MKKLGLLVILLFSTTLLCAAGEAEYKKAVSLSKNHQSGVLVKSLDLLEKSCTKGYTKACEELTGNSVLYFVAYGTKKMEKVSKHLNTACKGGSHNACFLLVDLYMKPNLSKAQKKHLGLNNQKAVQLLEKACQDGHNESCSFLGNIYLTGNTLTKQNGKKAEQLLVKSCNDGYQKSCGALALVYYNGLAGVKKDTAKAKKILKGSCDKNNADGCYKYATILKDQKQTKQAESYFNEICNNNQKFSMDTKSAFDNTLIGNACLDLAVIYLQRGKNDKDTVALLDKSCKKGNNLACKALK